MIQFIGFDFSNIFNILAVLIFFLIGFAVAVAFMMYGLKPKNQILYLRERDGRGLEMNLEKEDAISFLTKSNPPLRFFKYGRSYEFRRRGRAYTRFIGKEGTAYTCRLEGFTPKNMVNLLKPKEEPERELQKVTLEFPTLEDAVRMKWGEEFYSTVPDKRKEILRDDKLLLTVGLEAGLTPHGYEPITESTVVDKADEDMAGLLARAAKGIIKKDYWERIAYIGCGIAIGFAIHIFMLA